LVLSLAANLWFLVLTLALGLKSLLTLTLKGHSTSPNMALFHNLYHFLLVFSNDIAVLHRFCGITTFTAYITASGLEMSFGIDSVGIVVRSSVIVDRMLACRLRRDRKIKDEQLTESHQSRGSKRFLWECI